MNMKLTSTLHTLHTANNRKQEKENRPAATT